MTEVLRADPTDDPLALFNQWLQEAWEEEKVNANAMTVASVDADGRPSARVVLLKEVDDRGFVFYTNFQSRKGGELLGRPSAAICFFWRMLARQVRIEGPVETVGEAQADAYFASRPRDSQIGAWASDQSRPLADRSDLERRVGEYERKFAGREVPRPPHWSGFRVVARRIEFWSEQPFRLHDRVVYERAGEGWRAYRLYP
jgi:pyridoxamine 5'-phosphate oxidase